jgi:hypothetical protein
MREGRVEKVQASLPQRAGRKLAARSRRLDRDERAKILKAQNLLAKAHSTRLPGAPRAST